MHFIKEILVYIVQQQNHGGLSVRQRELLLVATTNNKSLSSNILSLNGVNQHAKSPNLYRKFKDG